MKIKIAVASLAALLATSTAAYAGSAPAGAAAANRMFVSPLTVMGLSATSLCGAGALGCVLPLSPAVAPPTATLPAAAPAAAPAAMVPAAAGLPFAAILGVGAAAALAFVLISEDDDPVSP